MRRYDIDALRVIAFGLLIFYHVGTFFVPWGFHIKNNVVYEGLVIPMLFLNQWRLPVNKVYVQFEKEQKVDEMEYIFVKSEKLLKKIILKEILFLESMENLRDNLYRFRQRDRLHYT